MKKRLLKRLIIGFVFGMIVGNVIEIVLNLITTHTFSLASETQVVVFGLALTIVLQTLLSGLFGAICFGGITFYEIEKWNITISTVTHFLSMLISYFTIAFLLRWIPFEIVPILIVCGVFLVSFALVWLIMFFYWKKKIEEMNKELEDYQKGDNKE